MPIPDEAFKKLVAQVQKLSQFVITHGKSLKVTQSEMKAVIALQHDLVKEVHILSTRLEKYGDPKKVLEVVKWSPVMEKRITKLEK